MIAGKKDYWTTTVHESEAKRVHKHGKDMPKANGKKAKTKANARKKRNIGRH